MSPTEKKISDTCSAFWEADKMLQMDKTEFISRMKAMTEEQKRLAVKEIPDRILWDELEARYIKNKRKVHNTEKALRMH